MASYRPALGFKGRTFELWALNRWVFNFCVRSTLQRVPLKRSLYTPNTLILIFGLAVGGFSGCSGSVHLLVSKGPSPVSFFFFKSFLGGGGIYRIKS